MRCGAGMRRPNKPAVWVVPETDGMATLGATMTAHNAAIAHNAVLALAALAPHDTRSRDARSSDALFALLTGTAFRCDCDREDYCRRDSRTRCPGGMGGRPAEPSHRQGAGVGARDRRSGHRRRA